MSWLQLAPAGRRHPGRLIKPFAPAPPPGATPAPLWGDEAHVCALFDGSTLELTTERRMLAITRFASALDQVLIDQANQWQAGSGRMEWEYLLVLARTK